MYANEARYRIKKWTKAKSLPTNDGNSYWVPNQDIVTLRPSSRSEDVVPWRGVHDFRQRVPSEGVAMSEKANELDIWWRPNREESLLEFNGSS